MKKIKRIVINLFLITGLSLSIVLTIKAYCLREWNTIASCLAVITAIIATFFSVRIIWKQEDDYEPDIIAFFDLDSRSQIIQLVIRNIGGSNAYDIQLNWKDKLIDSNNILVELPYVPVLTKGDCIRLFVGISTDRFENAIRENIKLVYKGNIHFKYSKTSSRYTKKDFEISLEQFRNKLRPITDEQEFHLKNAHLNHNIKEINETLKSIVNKMSK